MITDSWLKAHHRKKRDSELVVADRDGLSARVSPSGGISFVMRYRLHGKPKKPTLGKYPFMSLKEARDENNRLRGFLQRGIDPASVLSNERTQKRAEDCLSEAFIEWMEKDGKNKKKAYKEIIASFELHIFPVLGDESVGSIDLQRWLDLLEPLAVEKSAMAERLLVNIKQMYRWLSRRKRVPGNPLSEISAWNDLGIRKKNSYRSLSDDELSLVIEGINKSRMTGKNKTFLRLCLLYGCRPSELRQSLRDHFDFESNVWTVPPANHKLGDKTGKPLKRPITPLAKKLILEAFALSKHESYAFISSDSNDKQLTRSSILPLPYNIMQWVRRHKGINMDHWSVYDLRKTARTNWSTITQPHVAEIMLGHKLPGEWQVYDQYDYLTEQMEAYDAWGERLLSFGF